MYMYWNRIWQTRNERNKQANCTRLQAWKWMLAIFLSLCFI